MLHSLRCNLASQQTSVYLLYTLFAPIQVAESKDTDVKKVLILGSGGLSIGQAGEFDYSGSQVNFVDRKAIHLSYLYHPCIVCRR